MAIRVTAEGSAKALVLQRWPRNSQLLFQLGATDLIQFTERGPCSLI